MIDGPTAEAETEEVLDNTHALAVETVQSMCELTWDWEQMDTDDPEVMEAVIDAEAFTVDDVQAELEARLEALEEPRAEELEVLRLLQADDPISYLDSYSFREGSFAPFMDEGAQVRYRLDYITNLLQDQEDIADAWVDVVAGEFTSAGQEMKNAVVTVYYMELADGTITQQAMPDRTFSNGSDAVSYALEIWSWNNDQAAPLSAPAAPVEPAEARPSEDTDAAAAICIEIADSAKNVAKAERKTIMRGATVGVAICLGLAAAGCAKYAFWGGWGATICMVLVGAGCIVTMWEVMTGANEVYYAKLRNIMAQLTACLADLNILGSPPN